MPVPLVGAAAAAAAKVISKKLAQRAAGGITGAGSKSVNPVYRETGPIKVNSNPNKTPAKGERNPTQNRLDWDEKLEPWYDKFGRPTPEVKKINSNPRPGK
jgi:hypothetical protein